MHTNLNLDIRKGWVDQDSEFREIVLSFKYSIPV